MTTIAVPSSTTAKLGRVATIGYHQPQAWQIVTRMVDEQGWPLVDIRYSYHTVPDTCAVDLPLWCFETVALLQRYGLLTPLSHARQEQLVLLPGYGECTLSLSVCLWLPPRTASTGNNGTVAPAQDEHEPHPSTGAARESLNPW